MCDIKGVLLHMLCAIDRAHNNYHNMIIITDSSRSPSPSPYNCFGAKIHLADWCTDHVDICFVL